MTFQLCQRTLTKRAIRLGGPRWQRTLSPSGNSSTGSRSTPRGDLRKAAHSEAGISRLARACARVPPDCCGSSFPPPALSSGCSGFTCATLQATYRLTRGGSGSTLTSRGLDRPSPQSLASVVSADNPPSRSVRSANRSPPTSGCRRAKTSRQLIPGRNRSDIRHLRVGTHHAMPATEPEQGTWAVDKCLDTFNRSNAPLSESAGLRSRPALSQPHSRLRYIAIA